MKSVIKILLFALLPFTVMSAESHQSASGKIHKVIFEVTSDGAENWLGALRNVENARQSLGAESVQFEVVMHGRGLGLLLEKNAMANPELKGMLEKLHADGVVLAACENTMKRHRVEREDLVEQATTVDSGVGEVIRKQAEDYTYIKIGG